TCRQPVGDDAVPPWEKGVSEDAKKQARDLTREGNQMVKEYQWAEAADKYRAALQLWGENPAINYNLAMALLNLDSPLELYQALTKAVKYGAPGLANSDAKFA